MDNNSKYKEILNSQANKICVIAGPGSGKTKEIIIPKTQQLIAAGINEDEILLLSFSRLSAIDLKERVRGIGGKLKASTVHSFALAFLLEENDHDIRDRIKSFLLDFEKEIVISDLQIMLTRSGGKRVVRKMLEEFCAGWAVRPHDDVFEKDDNQRRFKLAVIRWLEEHKAVMIDEVIYFALDHAKRSPTSSFFGRFKYLLIDEYQDLNKLEQEFVGIVAQQANLMLVVGDPDQSIYSFKYAYREGITELYQAAGVEPHTLSYCGRCPKKVLAFANQLLIQENPARTQLPLPLSTKEDGEVDMPAVFSSQNEEFIYILDSISKRLSAGASPREIMILAPKKKLQADFSQFANANFHRYYTNAAQVRFMISGKVTFTVKEQSQILLLGLYVQPDSLLRIRTYLGLGDDSHYAAEIKEVKSKYGDITTFLSKADPNDFPKKKRRVRELCERAIRLKALLSDPLSAVPVRDFVDRLFPIDDPELSRLNQMLTPLVDHSETISELYKQFSDSLRLPASDDTIRIMSIMDSKGLDADHVFVIGCNAGNIPGQRRSEHITDDQHRQEQRRFLYVAFTRAKKTLTVTWSKLILWEQSVSHNTAGLRTVRGTDGKVYKQVGMCGFLQDLSSLLTAA